MTARGLNYNLFFFVCHVYFGLWVQGWCQQFIIYKYNSCCEDHAKKANLFSTLENYHRIRILCLLLHTYIPLFANLSINFDLLCLLLCYESIFDAISYFHNHLSSHVTISCVGTYWLITSGQHRIKMLSGYLKSIRLISSSQKTTGSQLSPNHNDEINFGHGLVGVPNGSRWKFLYTDTTHKIVGKWDKCQIILILLRNILSFVSFLLVELTIHCRINEPVQFKKRVGGWGWGVVLHGYQVKN